MIAADVDCRRQNPKKCKITRELGATMRGYRKITARRSRFVEQVPHEVEVALHVGGYGLGR
jgi:hypothetical protein